MIGSKRERERALRRLERLADIVENAERDKVVDVFQMSTWGFRSDETNACHTTACALGAAALSGKFSRAGLGHNWRSYDGYREGKERIVFTWKGEPYSQVGIARELFKLGVSEHRELFLGSHRNAREETATIRGFVSRRRRELQAS